MKNPDAECNLEELNKVFDEIMLEYQHLSGEMGYDRYLQEIDIKLWTNYKLRAIDLAIKCLELSYPEGAKEMIEEFKLKVTVNEKKTIDKAAINQLKSLYSSITNRLKVKAAKEREEKLKSPELKIIWEDRLTYIHRGLGIMPDYNCSVTLYLSYDKQAKALQQAKEKTNG